jgi:NitT/TauT family transport system substrate-binding protein
MTPDLPVLRLNQGDPSEARIYYCTHFVAAALGCFADEGLEVAFTWSESGGRTVRGGQIPAVLNGTADLAIGGPMVLMRMVEEGGQRAVAFCAAVAANPWVLVAGQPQPGFAVRALAGRQVCDIGRIGTASLAFAWLLRRHGVAGVNVTPGSGDEAADIAAVAAGRVAYGLHSLHALGPAVAAGQLHVMADLARLTGPVPWSAYIARPDRLAAAPRAFDAFTRAIARAQGWMARRPPGEIAALVAPHYPDVPPAALLAAIGCYQAWGVFAAGPLIGRPAHEHFARILTEAGWLKAPVAYDDVVVTTHAGAAARAAEAGWPR